MEPTSSRLKAAQEDDHLASFRRRNNRLIIILFSLIILFGLLIGTVIISLLQMQHRETYRFIHSGSAVQSFCSYTYYPFDCTAFFNSEIKPKSRTNPNELFNISLRTAIKQLRILAQVITNIESTDTQTESAVKNCSSLVQKSLSHLSDTLSLFRVNPDVRRQTDEQRNNTTNWIMATEQDLSSCYDYLTEIDTSAGEIRGKVHKVMVHASNSAHFLLNYGSVFFNFHHINKSSDFRISIARISSGFYRENVFTASMIALQYLFLIGLFCTLYRIHRK